VRRRCRNLMSQAGDALRNILVISYLVGHWVVTQYVVAGLLLSVTGTCIGYVVCVCVCVHNFQI
jgi:hypothetical protein